ncbi:hypothetical protein P7K49_001226 [Saguinus oedipus]|uniref:Uncharacterized protein n=1 Tax=Saguinus oedipus TaxID=9490 RepID=A0ABQ9WDW3_SAGOE|nr:hypothetical protein P7K49_001226 [Saguinus oedipus]
MEKFLIQLQHLEYLEALMGLEAQELSGTLGSDNLRLQLKMYFQRIHDYLEKPGLQQLCLGPCPSRNQLMSVLCVQSHKKAEQSRKRPLKDMEQKLTTESRSPGSHKGNEVEEGEIPHWTANIREGSHDFYFDNFPGTATLFLIFR